MTTLWRRRPFGFTDVIPRHSETSRLAVECLVVRSCRSGAEPYPDFLSELQREDQCWWLLRVLLSNAIAIEQDLVDAFVDISSTAGEMIQSVYHC